MTRHLVLGAITACLALGSATAVLAPVDPAEKPAEEATKAVEKPSAITMRIAVSAEGMERLPEGSRVELKGENGCKNLERGQMILSGGALFPDLPLCKVKLRIFITGFPTKAASLDLTNYKRPITVVVREDGPLAVTW